MAAPDTNQEGTLQSTLSRKPWIARSLALLLSTLIFATFALPLVRAQADRPKVRGFLFYSQSCPTCPRLRAEVLAPLYSQYGQQLEITAIDAEADEPNASWLEACQERFGLPTDRAAVPVLFMGDTALSGAEEIERELPTLVERYAQEGGVDFPGVPRPGGPLEPTVRFAFFYSPSCPHCRDVEENVLPRIRAKYGDRVKWEALDRSDESSYRALLILGEITDLPQDARGAVPLSFMGDEYSAYARFLGGIEIDRYLEPAIEWYMALGGVDLPGWWPELIEMARTPFPEEGQQAATATPVPPVANTKTPPTATPAAATPDIHVAYFAEVGCSECDAVSAALEHVQTRYPSLVLHEYDILDDVSLNLCLSEMLDVPEDKRHDAPAVFVGTDYLVAKDVSYQSLLALVAKYAETGAEPLWEDCDQADPQVPPPPPWWAVILPGLADGINPCAFATIIFFISYLSLIEAKGRTIVLVGIAFTLAVFLSYLAFGIVLREVFAGLISWTGPVLRPILNIIMALVCILLAVLSFADFSKARQGRTKEMALRLPDRLRAWINATIRRSMKSGTLIAASFVAGVIISFIELTCTGQVYVPIILGLSVPGYRAQALVALVVYCLAFIMPLVIVFVISYLGTSSRTLGVFLQRHTATIKLITAVVFLVIGAWLLYDTLRVSGVLTPLLASAPVTSHSIALQSRAPLLRTYGQTQAIFHAALGRVPKSAPTGGMP
jgi:cytochrome c biogenesis protein CcdA/thiol-disulfide isomerase/thioredoxin